MASHARVLAKEKVDLESQLRELMAQHNTLGSQLKFRVDDIEGAQDLEVSRMIEERSHWSLVTR